MSKYICQKNNVTVYYQLFEDTISIRIWGTLKRKQNIINTIMGQVDFNEDEVIDQMLNEIIEDYEWCKIIWV